MNYGSSAHKHAVTAWNGNSYGYDANGNQTTRTVGGSTSTLTYDAENRLTAVSGATSASFKYDGACSEATYKSLYRHDLSAARRG